ncbi:hypothetical protein GCM10009839_92020 [Catenulispora yoronensis]|uniref:Acyl carrier protein n=1 Tax=Catenulispora yoronensis TaxID=450799 RepID=A0ABP5H9Y5_9ACTN
MPSDPYARLATILTGRLEIHPDLVRPEATLRQVELDSLAIEEFITVACREFQVGESEVEQVVDLPLAEAAEALAAGAR